MPVGVQGIVLVLVLVLVLDPPGRGSISGPCIGLRFDHEKLDVYRFAIELVAWAGVLSGDRVRTPKPNALKHLDDAGIWMPAAIGPGKASRIRIVSMLTKLTRETLVVLVGTEHEYEHEYEYERAN